MAERLTTSALRRCLPCCGVGPWAKVANGKNSKIAKAEREGFILITPKFYKRALLIIVLDYRTVNFLLLAG